MTLKPPDMREIKRVLIVKLSAIGDVVHALPVSAALGESFPHLEISWVVEPMSAPMLTGNPYLKEVIVLPAEWRKHRFSASSYRRFRDLRSELRSREFDMAIDLQGLSKSALMAWASGAPYRFGYDWLRELAPHLLQRVPRRPESVHVVDQMLDVVQFLGGTTGEVRFPLVVTPDEDGRAAAILGAAGVDATKPFIVINPSAGGGGFKGWGIERFAAACSALAEDPGYPIVLVGSKGDLALAERLQEQAVGVKSIVAKTDLRELTAVLRRTTLHLCGDTGSAHIAAALRTPVVSIFGRSNPARLAPYGQERFALHHRERCAEPCRRFHESAPVNSKQKCLSPPPVCLGAVSVEEVVDACRRALRA